MFGWCDDNGYVNVDARDGGGGEPPRGDGAPCATHWCFSPSGPNAHHERRSVPLPPDGPERDAFMRDFVVVDVQSNSARVGNRTLW